MVAVKANKPSTMHIQSIIRKVQPIKGFVYHKAKFCETRRGPSIRIAVKPRVGSRAICSGCGIKRPGYDTLPCREFTFVPLWGMLVVLAYAVRRVECARCGVTAEMLPWAAGKSPMTEAYTWFLASWAKVLSWRETATRFRTSWDAVFRAVDHAVTWGLAHRNLDNIRSVGVDELSWKKGHKYLTVVYQIDHGCRRLLHIARDRKIQSFNTFFDLLGPERSSQIAFVASDMWKAFLHVVQARCSQAVHVLDRFHVMQLMSRAVDETRRAEVRALRTAGRPAILTKTRWILLKRRRNLKSKERTRLKELVNRNLRSMRAYLLKEEFQHFWSYTSVWGGRRFLKEWTTMALRSRIKPIQKFARTLRAHEPLLLNWFRARGTFASGATEGFNNKARITTRKAYGFRSYEHVRIALFHALGDLPTPPWLAHKFF